MGKKKEKQEVVDPSLETRDIIRLFAVLAVAISNGEVPPLQPNEIVQKAENTGNIQQLRENH